MNYFLFSKSNRGKIVLIRIRFEAMTNMNFLSEKNDHINKII